MFREQKYKALFTFLSPCFPIGESWTRFTFIPHKPLVGLEQENSISQLPHRTHLAMALAKAFLYSPNTSADQGTRIPITKFRSTSLYHLAIASQNYLRWTKRYPNNNFPLNPPLFFDSITLLTYSETLFYTRGLIDCLSIRLHNIGNVFNRWHERCINKFAFSIK